MPDLPTDMSALAMLVFGLGLRHGFDPDHLAAIDGLTRYNARANPRLARVCGALFALGHGAVIVLVAVAVNLLARQWDTPEWLEMSGAWISIGFLALLGIMNLRAAWQTDPLRAAPPAGIRAQLLGPLAQSARPALVALVGALFALSFDAISLASLFAWAGAHHGGWTDALLLALLFALGMLITDGANGMWVARLVRHADRAAVIAARVMSLTVALASLLVAALGAARLIWPSAADADAHTGALISLALIAMLTASYLLARWLARRAAPALAQNG
ncbi:MAG: nickel transporter [Rhodocyclaceae bacterium]|nr:nickel transporter [Rhodocyclaceae bacterium]